MAQIGVKRLHARQAGNEIARLLWTGLGYKQVRSAVAVFDTFEVIWDEVASGNHTYGKSAWTRFIAAQPVDSDYWYKRIRNMTLAEIENRLTYSAEID